MAKKRLFVDLDNTLVDFPSGVARLAAQDLAAYEGRYDECPGIFALMDPIPGAVEAYRELSEVFDTYILSTAPWLNPSAWSDKLEWVHLHFGAERGSPAYKRLIISHHKNLCAGDFLVDDRPNNGAEEFEGEWVRFGSERFSDWPATVAYLVERA